MGPLPLSVSIAPRPSLTDTNSVWNLKGEGARWVALVCQISTAVRACLAHRLVFRSVKKAVALWDMFVLFLSASQGHVGHVEMITLIL